MKKYISIGILMFLAIWQVSLSKTEKSEEIRYRKKSFSFEAEKESLNINLNLEDKQRISLSLFSKEKVKDFNRDENKVVWNYSDDSRVELKKEKDYLKMTVKKGKNDSFTLGDFEGDSYYLPIGEGKFIPSNDSNWLKFLGGEVYDTLESFSMQFFSVNKGDNAVVFIMENPYNNEIRFKGDKRLSFDFTHEFIEFNGDKTFSFRVYVAPNNPVDVAKVYKEYMVEKGKFKTLKEKEKKTKDIEKLYGAPHIYLWGQEFIASDNIKWQELLAHKEILDNLYSIFDKLLVDKVEVLKVLNDLKKQAYADKYQKNTLVKGINEILLKKEFSNSKEDNLKDIYLDNKIALKSIMKNSIDEIEKWGNGNSIELLNDMKKRGLDRAWLGFDGWETGYINPNFVEKAKGEGFLVGTYDSYHSIHKSGQEQWSTAKFSDEKAYDDYTITNKFDEKLKGFNGVGRKLNPAYSYKYVEERVNKILGDGVGFNSWFIDCDAAGEIYDDYSKKTTKKEDLEARLKRMRMIEDKGLVIGSEMGLDYAASTIAFAHGLETPVMAWGDKDMKDKNSKWFVGKYYASQGGVPEIFEKEIPLKNFYRDIYLNPKYNLPLYKLVYNDSVITTHHWLYGSFKLKDDIETRKIYEMLYNVPPLYHLDKRLWEKYRDKIIEFHKIWSPFHEKVVNEEMTDFSILTEDRMVQKTSFGTDISIIGNFSDKEYFCKGKKIKAKEFLVIEN